MTSHRIGTVASNPRACTGRESRIQCFPVTRAQRVVPGARWCVVSDGQTTRVARLQLACIYVRLRPLRVARQALLVRCSRFICIFGHLTSPHTHPSHFYHDAHISNHRAYMTLSRAETTTTSTTRDTEQREESDGDGPPTGELRHTRSIVFTKYRFNSSLTAQTGPCIESYMCTSLRLLPHMSVFLRPSSVLWDLLLTPGHPSRTPCPSPSGQAPSAACSPPRRCPAPPPPSWSRRPRS